MKPELIKKAYQVGVQRALEDLGMEKEAAAQTSVDITNQKENDLRDTNASQD